MAVKSTNPNNILRDIAASFRSNYQYKILGKTDSFFQYTAKMIESDTTKLSLFKSRRIAEQTQLNKISNNTALSDNEKLQASAETKIGYLKDAYRTLKSATYNLDKIKTTNFKYSVSYFLKELEGAVKDYITSRGGAVGGASSSEDVVDISEEGQALSGGEAKIALTAADQNFLRDAQKLVDDVGRIASKLRIKVRSEGIFFDNTTYQASKRVDTLKALLASVQGGFTPAPPASSVEEGTDTADTNTNADPDTTPDSDPAPESGGLDITV
jgi:hypothetical protein